MNRRTLIFLKSLTWVGCLLPLASLVYHNLTSPPPDPTATIASVTGLTTLWLLVATLTISPLRALSPRLSWLIKFRRLLGMFAFFYASLHMLTWLILYTNLDPETIRADIEKRRFIIMGVATYLLLLPLALTSTNWAIRKMGGKNWNRLHMLIYASAVTAIIHYWWKVKSGVLTPIPLTLIVAFLLALRPVLAWNRKRKSRAAIAAVPASR